MGQFDAYFAAMFASVEREHGPLDPNILSSIIGFSGGGPVQLSQIAEQGLFVTCELSLYPEQRTSTEGMRFELLSRAPLAEPEARRLLTALGGLSMKAQLGHGHTIDVGGILSSATTVELKLHSECMHSGQRLGIYEVLPCA